MNDFGANKLIYAIVNQACVDYIRARKRLHKWYQKYEKFAKTKDKYLLPYYTEEELTKKFKIDRKEVEKELGRVVNFFKSSWYETLMPDIASDSLIKKLDEIALTKSENTENEESEDIIDVF